MRRGRSSPSSPQGRHRDQSPPSRCASAILASPAKKTPPQSSDGHQSAVSVCASNAFGFAERKTRLTRSSTGGLRSQDTSATIDGCPVIGEDGQTLLADQSQGQITIRDAVGAIVEEIAAA